MRRWMAFVLAAVLIGGLSACAGPPVDPDEAQESIQVIAMDTVMILSAYGEKSTHAVYTAEDEIRRLEDMLSRTLEDSGVSRLNQASGETVAVEPEIARLLLAAAEYTQATDGAFDITIAPVVSAWGFTTDSYQVPSQSQLDTLLQTVDGAAVQAEVLADGSARAALLPGQSIDLGGIAKGYVSDCVLDIFIQNAVPRGLARLGGNVLAWGDRPDGTPWRVGVQDPQRPDDANGFVGVLELKNAYAVTSGGYQRYFEEDGKTYHHIIDPATGYPADSGLTSVTIVADCGSERLNGEPGSGTMCDALSTALFVMGEEKALDFWRNSGYDFDLILVTEDGRVVLTEGIADAFTQDEPSGYSYEIVS